MNKNILVSVLYVVLLLVLSAHSFAIQDYSVVGAKNIVAPSCSISQESILINNVGTEAIKPIVQLDSAPDWVTLVGGSELLAPGEQGVATLFIQPPCGLESQRDISIDITNTQEDKVLKQSIQVINPNNINVQAQTNVVETCPCEQQKVPFSIVNTGLFRETYTLDLRGKIGLPLATQQVTIPAGESYMSFVTLESACDQYGSFETNLKVQAQQSGWSYELPIQTEVGACYEYSIAAPTTIDVCASQNIVQSVFIQNQAPIPNAYTIDLEYQQEGVELSGDYVELEGLAKGQVDLLIDGSVVQNHTFTLVVDAQIGDLRAQQDISILQTQCFETALSFTQEVQVCQDQIDVPITVTSTKGTQSLSIIVPNETYLSLDQSSFEVDESSSAQAVLTISAQEIEAGEYSIPILAYSNETNQVVEYELLLQNIGRQECYLLELDPTTITWQDNQTRYNLSVTYVGLVNTTFDVSTNVSNISITPSTIQIGVDQQTQVQVDIGADVESFDVVFSNDKVQGSYEVRIGQGVDWIIILIVVLILLILLILLLAVISMGGKSHKEKEEKEKPLSFEKDENPVHWIRFIIFILIVLVIVIFFLWLFFVTLSPAGTKINETNNETLGNQTQINISEENVEENTTIIDVNQTDVQNNDTQGETNQTQEDQGQQGPVCDIWCRLRSWLFPTPQEPETTNETIDQNTSKDNQTNRSVLDLFEELINNQSENQSEVRNVSQSEKVLAFIQEANESGRLNSFSVQIVEADTPTTINLSRYFIDLDNDTLAFTALPTEHLTITFEDGVATITRADDFVGLVNTSFIATDSQGGKTTSPQVTFALPPGPQPSQWTQWGTWILVAIIILAVLILLFLAYRSED